MYEELDDPVEIYAELSKKQFNLVVTGQVTLEVPYGVSLKNKIGSRALHFQCPNKLVAKELGEGLDNSSINWQESN